MTVVEWDCGLVERLADAHLLVRLERADDLEERTAVLEPSGGSWADRPAGISARS